MVAKVVSAEEAAKLVKDGATITVGVSGEQVLSALEVRFLTEGHPKDLCWFDPSPTGSTGFEHLSHEGLLRRVIESWFITKPELIRLIKANKVEAYSYPLATSHFLIREIGAGRKGYLTKVGLHTFLDPRQGGGRLNARTTENLIEVRQFGGEEWLWYNGFPIDVAIIRGTSADEAGNIGLEEEPLSNGVLNQAQAAKSSGGIVIAQVKRRVRKGAIHPRAVLVPGWLVDYIVVDPNQPQNATFPDRYVEGVSGSPRVPDPPLTSYPISALKLAGRRAALELRPGDFVNAGVNPFLSGVFPVSWEEGIGPLYTLTVEFGHTYGLHGGTPGELMGMVINPTYMPDFVTLFNHYYGGNLDATYLGMAQVDAAGNNNVNYFGGILAGPGGAMDIAQSARKVVFCGPFTAGGLEVEATGGRLRIVREGRIIRFVKQVEQICFNGRDFSAMGKEVLFITERAVFRLTATGIELTEVAPGIDVERDVLGQMEFRPEISPGLKEMEPRIFDEAPMGLHQDWTGRPFVPAVPIIKAATVSFGQQVGWQREQ